MEKLKSALKSFLKILEKITKPIGIVVSAILLTLVYFVVIGLAAMVGMIFRRDFIDSKKKGPDTYWKDADFSGSDIKKYYRQY